VKGWRPFKAAKIADCGSRGFQIDAGTKSREPPNCWKCWRESRAAAASRLNGDRTPLSIEMVSMIVELNTVADHCFLSLRSFSDVSHSKTVKSPFPELDLHLFF
jgi:hypothetical protein